MVSQLLVTPAGREGEVRYAMTLHYKGKVRGRKCGWGKRREGMGMSSTKEALCHLQCLGLGFRLLITTQRWGPYPLLGPLYF